MAGIASTFRREGNYVPITGRGIVTKRTLTFNGGTTNDWGDDGGDLDGGVVYTVTGLVEVQLYGRCTEDLVGGATVEVGVTGGVAIFCAQVTDTTIDENHIYLQDSTPATSFLVGAEEQEAANNLPTYALNGLDIILTTTTTNTTSGVIDFYCIWTPISDNGNVTATTT